MAAKHFYVQIISYNIIVNFPDEDVPLIPYNTVKDTKKAIADKRGCKILLVCKKTDEHQFMTEISDRSINKLFSWDREDNTEVSNIEIIGCRSDENYLKHYLVKKTVRILHAAIQDALKLKLDSYEVNRYQTICDRLLKSIYAPPLVPYP
ncbi:unnamed protein product [Rotaria magnacalcarata]|uniref:Uncharacterized protein n=1 Tax=Rotaria magnacalcarata TaxID=392030 RepID=A0A816X6M6_9BILA|nr:unnamed protein product [Rotaria magnacalcarata]CAF2271538.1 unnamed protein product [Rotaria magnacalcarata]